MRSAWGEFIRMIFVTTGSQKFQFNRLLQKIDLLERDKHHGGTKTESGNNADAVGSYFEYTFNGTGVEVYSQKHAQFASFNIFIDNEDMGNHSLEVSSSGENQQLAP